jgi:hypothetical protein
VSTHADRETSAPELTSFSGRFGHEDSELDDLVADLTESTRYELGQTLEQVRRASLHLRPTLAIAIPLVLARDGLTSARMKRALAHLRALIEAFPVTVRR